MVRFWSIASASVPKSLRDTTVQRETPPHGPSTPVGGVLGLRFCFSFSWFGQLGPAQTGSPHGGEGGGVTPLPFLNMGPEILRLGPAFPRAIAIPVHGKGELAHIAYRRYVSR
jgi:hypothetical protein